MLERVVALLVRTHARTLTRHPGWLLDIFRISRWVGLFESDILILRRNGRQECSWEGILFKARSVTGSAGSYVPGKKLIGKSLF